MWPVLWPRPVELGTADMAPRVGVWGGCCYKEVAPSVLTDWEDWGSDFRDGRKAALSISRASALSAAAGAKALRGELACCVPGQ